MKILSVNAGSSSLKFQMYEMPEEKVLISGVFERIGLENSFYTLKINGEKIKKEANLTDHEVAVNIVINELLENKIIDSLDEIKGVGHRIVHGADKFSKSVVLTDEIIKQIEEFNDLAPLHNPANIMGVRAFEKAIHFNTFYHFTHYIASSPYLSLIRLHRSCHPCSISSGVNSLSVNKLINFSSKSESNSTKTSAAISLGNNL